MIGQQVQPSPPQGAPMPAQGAAQTAPAPAAPRDVSGGGEDQPNVTPEEQAQYDEFVKNGLAMIYPGGGEAQIAPPIMQHLQGKFGQDEQQMLADADPPVGQSPNDALAATTVLIVLALDNSANAAGHRVDDDVVMHGGKALLEELAEASEAAGIHDYSEGELEASLYRAMDLFRVSSPRVDQDQLKQQFGEIQKADQEGTLDKLLPGIGSRMQAQEQQPAAPQQGQEAAPAPGQG